MNKRNYGMEYTERMTLRLTQEQMQFLVDIGHLLGISPSEYLRMTIQAGLVAKGGEINAMLNGKMPSEIKKGEVGSNNEDDKTNINNLV